MVKKKGSGAPQGAWGQVKKGWRSAKHWLDGPGVLPWIANLALAFIIIKFIVYPLLGWLFGTSLPIVAVVSSSMDHDALNGQVCGVVAPSGYRDNLDGYWTECGAWYEARGITKVMFQDYAFKNGFNKGDIMVVLGQGRSKVNQGDILIFQAAENYPIIHRVIATPTIASPYFATKGDHNPEQISEYVLRDEFSRAWRCESGGKASPCVAGAVPVSASTPGAVRIIDETRISQDQVIGKAVLRVPWLGWVKIWFTDLIGLLA